MLKMGDCDVGPVNETLEDVRDEAINVQQGLKDIVDSKSPGLT
jgi:hypothetical protein